MSTALTIAAALSALSLIVLGVLAVVWIREYRTVGTSLVLGLTVFILVLLVENAVALGFYVTMNTLYVDDPVVRQIIAVTRGLQLVALLLFAYVSLD
jgi:hypothetical protein